MDKATTEINSLKLIGLTTRTNNANEQTPGKSRIAKMIMNYWSNSVADNFKNRQTPGITYAVYTDYESDEHGDYTYFIGELVTRFDEQNLCSFDSLIIPAGRYQKFTTPPGKMPSVVIEAWQAIWKMKSSELGGVRSYIADFEVYDQRVVDPSNAIVDVYIGIN